MGGAAARFGRFMARFLAALLATLICVRAAAQGLETVYSFPPRPILVPDGPLIQGSDGNLYGASRGQSSTDHGAVFKMALDGTLTVLHAFHGSDVDSSKPNRSLVEGRDGSLYGTTEGESGLGVIYKITPSGVFTIIHRFVASGGWAARAGLSLSWDGNFYGLTSRVGGNPFGGIFRLTPSGEYADLFAFDSRGTIGGAGSWPLAVGDNGALYGMTEPRASFPFPRPTVLFRLQPWDGLFIVMRVFEPGLFGVDTMASGSGALVKMPGSAAFVGCYRSSGSSGFVFVATDSDFGVAHRFFEPEGAPVYLTPAANGNYYGVTAAPDSFGTVFRMTFPSSRFPEVTVVKTFMGVDGQDPLGLVQASDGDLYGVTQSQGPQRPQVPTLPVRGTIFRLTLDGEFTNLHVLTAPVAGAYPSAPLILASDGSYYGTTRSGATESDGGTIFRLTPGGAVSILHAFATPVTDLPITDGGPAVGLVQAADNALYGVSRPSSCAPAVCATSGLFRLAFDGTYTSITEAADVANGSALIQAADGALYGTAPPTDSSSGLNPGRVFKLTLPDALEFSGTANVGNPVGGLVQAAGGTFWGTDLGAPSGAVNGGVFRFDAISGPVARVLNFGSPPDPQQPRAALIQGLDGYFYGTSERGGSGNVGTVFKVTSVGALTVLHNFSGAGDGGEPPAPLIQALDGNLYGTTRYGGSFDRGTIFRISVGGGYTVLYSFTGGADGGHPGAALLEASPGVFLGTAMHGGVNGSGTIFRFTATATAAPAFTTQPHSRTVSQGSSVTFVAAAIGLPSPLYQWQTSLDGTTWTDITDSDPVATGARTTTLHLDGIGIALNGRRFRVIASNPSDSATSDVAILAVNAGACPIALLVPSAQFTAAGGTGQVVIETDGGCHWTASSDSAFVTVPPAVRTDSGTLAFTVASNTAGVDVATPTRTAILTIGERLFSVVQSGCTVAIAPSSLTVPALGGAQTVTVTTGSVCGWTATSLPVWVTTTAGGSGTGNGAWSFTASSNATGGTRSATMQIGGRPLPIVQFGGITTGLLPGQRKTLSLADASATAWFALDVVRDRSYCTQVAAGPGADAAATPTVAMFRADGTTAMPIGTPAGSRACFIAPTTETAWLRLGQSDAGPRQYRLSVTETTQWLDWFFVNGDYSSFTLLRNTSAAPVRTRVIWRTVNGVEAGRWAVTLAPGAAAAYNVRIMTGILSGSIDVAHDGEPGAVAASQTTLSAATGLSIDVLAAPRKEW